MKNKKYLTILIGIIVVLLLFVIFKNPQTKTPANILLVSSQDFISQYQNQPGSILIDVRTPEEYADGHIENAVNINLQDSNFRTELQSLDPNGTYFVYCRSGNRSAQAVLIMKRLGFKNIIELDGGILNTPELIQK